MTFPHLFVVEPGLFTTVQDLGRFGHQAQGIPVAGALDPLALRLANALVGNPQGAAALEIAYLGPTLRVEATSVRIAAGGPLVMTLERPGRPGRTLPPWRTHTLVRGDILSIARVSGSSVGVLAVAGGFALTPFLGSLSTYARAGLGPLGGRPLSAGTAVPLAVDAAGDGPDAGLRAAPDYGGGAIRVVPGPQEDHFTDEALETFLTAEYVVGKQADRMGLRLEGPRLAHRGSADVPSDGLVTGSIQVPGSGQPILLLNDRQTAGGYAKIATVISADLPRAARLRSGDRLTFAAVTVDEAETLRRRWEETLARTVAAIRPVGGLDLDLLASGNLISGVVAGDEG